MRGFCPECHNEIDEIEYIIKEKMCRDCFNKKKGDVVYTEDEIAQLPNGEIEPKSPEPFICQVINKECPTADTWKSGDCKSCKEKIPEPKCPICDGTGINTHREDDVIYDFPSDKDIFEHAYPDYKVVKREEINKL